ncbi:tRNA pseudouridine(32) synthase, mitochondrial [Wickerhamiella sorbophila]|uniref:tRNA pseudouridine(32) synthase, mitochondrial n=1 Tax=Wickerhamiella sorbophila TaxID=45607 RepID=A0A2T0FGI2_9ASCO|nr:tRNA pseudouridine(32) synthase, mitochondrial [Wickerhamiella sorbophila]PRT54112.1 tRNA pseudouridine(32) synthase, mitochondrial [Wickerhamiella sorbophila]
MPYYRTVTANAKGRWIGKPLEYVAKEVGALKISGPHDIVRNHDIINYEIHVHEAYVPDQPLQVLYSDDQLVVVDKPSGMPTHPTVNYFTKTATELLRPEYGPVVPCYRLDRLTTGVLVLFRTGEIAADLLKTPRRKTYLARVYGDFSGGECDAPIVTFNAKRGFQAFLQALKSAKPAHTRFQALYKDSSYTIVKCELETGRTHQIRKHLSLLGHPIVNDDLYKDGLFKELMADPVQSNFDRVVQASELRRREKDTGETCPECGATIYKDVDEAIDLHCYEYQIQQHTFKCLPYWIPKSLEAIL